MRRGLTIILILLFIFSINTASAATLQVDSKHYETIQSAIDEAHDGDTIKVSSGTYEENLWIEGKHVILTGTNYPKIYGATFLLGGNGTLYGFLVTKDGVYMRDGGRAIIRNCTFTNNGISIFTGTSIGNQLINNKFIKCGISIGDSYDTIITGNYIYKAPVGLLLYNGATCKLVNKNIFSNCQIAVQMEYPAKEWMINNKYIKNKVNFKITL